jgi:hypothetical protein
MIGRRRHTRQCCLKSGHTADALEEIPELHMVLLMSVNRLCGQRFIPSTLAKIRALKQLILHGVYTSRLKSMAVSTPPMPGDCDAGGGCPCWYGDFGQPDYEEAIRALRA